MQQMREAFPWDQAPRFVLRDRDAIYGTDFAAMTRAMGMEEVLTAPRSPYSSGRFAKTGKAVCGAEANIWPLGIAPPQSPI
jgi:hypothetical protein